MAGRLDGRVAIITGGGHGIGKAYAHGMAREGARVLAWIIHERAVTTARSAPRGCGRERMEPDISTGRPIVPRIPCGHRAGVDGRDRTALDNVSADSAPWA